jgi:hypothetical protein
VSALDYHLQRLTTNIRTLPEAPTTWSKILLVEDRDIMHTTGQPPFMHIPRWALRTPEDFAAKFDEYLRVGYTWINLHAAGLLDDVLIVILERPNKPSATAAGKPELVSVNLSGPASLRLDGPPEWKLTRQAVITE